ncbi:ubiquitin carboxyl-terminal hydrolase 5-like isoform X1 [Anneissia japonica]|uniref:ubiquitin carboxyl-terminal hydrolase 5-like isoform X1 n=1 Tax=Anneissia japonica TaxID=1529436 RepID=UPI0014254BE9|nr:ubiquitin carboxyl-terminal hydrolase 5-like isoform X1 [Anneissia japonica]
MVEVLSAFVDKISIPQGGDKIYKDECTYSFENPESENGLYVCMKTFLGFGKAHVLRHYNQTGNPVYLHLKTIKKKVNKAPETEEEKAKPTRLAIGVEGGFTGDDSNQYEYEENNSIVLLPDFLTFSLPDASLPEKVQLAVAGILSAESASRMEQVAAWDGEKRFISKHAENFKQLDNGVKIPPTGWKCAKCDLTQNLWVNLTDGTILCGRRYFDGSGGNNHAVEYFKEKGYPLAVKLGTITPNGADVFSYDEDDMVEDPKLAEHLSHFGINMMSMEKTDKTMTELEIDANMKISEWDVIQEAGKKLTPMFGSGYTGMRNLGNSCYMNSVMQVIFMIPDFIDRYPKNMETIFSECSNDPASDFTVQMAKLGHGLLSGDYSKETLPEEGEDETKEKSQVGIAPRMFKSLIGRGHPEFSTNRQQDAQEFLLHFMNIVERNTRGSSNPCDCFKVQLEDRIECLQSQQVRYTTRSDYMLSVPIPIEAATNIDEFAAYEKKKKELEANKESIDPKEVVRLQIPFTACLEKLTQPEIIDDFYSSALKARSTAKKITKLATFPDYLMLHLRKFTLGDDWVPKKLDVSVNMPDDLDLTSIRGKGLQPGEVELPEGDVPAEPEVVIDEAMVMQLVSMGFDYEGCKKAVYHTKNQGTEAAMNWVLEHMAEPDFTTPLELAKKKDESGANPSDENIVMIQSMGFTQQQAVKALKATSNNVERAADWIFSHLDELNSEPMETSEAGASSSGDPQVRDGSAKYKLVAFISHMGTSTSCGHYVCHIKKDGRWVLYNDNKVALSENLPRDLGYLYMYQRL